MQYPFPPPPPGYLVVLVARWLLVVWTLFAVGILIVRLRNWKFIRVRELAFWSCAALISAIVSKYGICRYRAFDNNDWLMPTVMAAMSVSVAGAAMGLSKLYADRSGQAKTTLPEASVAIAIVCVLFALLIEEPVDSSGAGQNCRRNLRELGLAMHNYQDEHGAFPSFRRGDEPVSWRVSLLPSLDQLPLFDSYDQSLPWNRPQTTRRHYSGSKNLFVPQTTPRSTIRGGGSHRIPCRRDLIPWVTILQEHRSTGSPTASAPRCLSSKPAVRRSSGPSREMSTSPRSPREST